MRPYRRHIALGLGAALFGSAASLAAPSVVRWGLEAVGAGNEGRLLVCVAWLLVIYLVVAASRYGEIYWGHIVGYSIVADLRTAIHYKLQSLSTKFFQAHKTGDLMARASEDIMHFENLTAHILPALLRCTVILLGVPVVLMLDNWQLAFICLCPVPLLIIATRRFGKKLYKVAKRRQAQHAQIMSLMNDQISGMNVTQAFTREPEEARRFDEENKRFIGVQLAHMRLEGVWSAVATLLSFIGNAAGLWFGGRLVLSGSLTAGDLVAFVLYLGMFYGPVIELNGIIEGLVRIRAGAGRVFEILDQEPVIADAPGARRPRHVEGTVALRDVRFSYEKDTEVLHDVSLRVEGGKTLALVGVSGSGKSTIAVLIPRFHDVDSGAVLVGGYDVRELAVRTLRQNISLVLQDTFLFNTSIAENIAYGRPNATREQVEYAAEMANAHEFIMEFPEGYNTVVGERGARLSGGQRQRISLARAILKDAPVLILDEATSAVDTDTEFKIHQAIDRLMSNRTTIVIAHRLSTVRNADEICVMSGGRIIERGAHEELIRSGGHYRHLYDVQFRPQEMKIPAGTESENKVTQSGRLA